MKTPPLLNLLTSPPPDSTAECFIPLLNHPAFKLEHIISSAHASAADFWYEQAEDEWVLLLSGSAQLQFADEIIALTAGDCLLIPAQTRHRVASCSIDARWLALHHTMV
ncbi:cupin domain-containing protein [Chitinibacter sp. S2-10]|uniref:cupin domain-containing protein n=1 Tax=Chitinibacter sp. S2-10 TaxID=3373597 RepID=UPI0039778A8A